MITLYTFGPAFGMPDSSPFVMKADVMLKMAGVSYKTSARGLRRAPKGKLPYIVDDGVTVADSSFIRWHVEQKYGFDFDSNLNFADRGIAWAFEKMVDEHLYWVMVYERWVVDVNFYKGPLQYFKKIPQPFRPLVTKIVRRTIGNTLKAQGLGRHHPDDMRRLALRDIEAISQQLGNKPWFMGEHPCSADASIFAAIAGILCPLFDTPLRRYVLTLPNLVAYRDRLWLHFYPELPIPS